MDQVVWKYPLELTSGEQAIEVPTSAKIVHVAMQGDDPTLWMLVERPYRITTVRRFVVMGTGEPVPGEFLYRGTAVQGAAVFLWHVFEVLPAGVQPGVDVPL